MGSVSQPDRQPPLVETSCLPDIWIDGIAKIEPLSGDCYRFVFFRTRTDENGTSYREAVASFVCPAGVVMTAANQALAAIARKVCETLN